MRPEQVEALVERARRAQPSWEALGFEGRAKVMYELRRWFESADRSYVFSFESVCDALGLDVGCIRQRVLQTAPTPVRRAWGHRVHAHRIVAPRVRRSAAASAL